VSDLFDKLTPLAGVLRRHGGGDATGDVDRPFDTLIEAVHGPVDATIHGRRVRLFGSNNYLGLTHHPRVVAAQQAAAATWGSGTTGSRVANGTLAIHRSLERELAAAFDKRHAMVFTTGHQANLSLLSALCGPDDVILLDVESHASVYDGAQLSRATVIGFRHNMPSDLDKKLARLPPGGRNRMVVIEGLYSTSGDLAPVAEIAEVVARRGGYLVVDEAHSFGVLGARGRGRAEAEGVLDRVDFVVGTFSKSLGGVGGFIVSNHDALPLLHYAARPYLFTASGSPATIEATREALRLSLDGDDLRATLWKNAHRWWEGLRSSGFSVSPTASPIVPIYTGDPDRAVRLHRYALARGVYTNLVLPPGCPVARSGLRTSVSSAHDESAIVHALDVFAGAARDLGTAP
jgi:8-amino-7-oxononanoate synthase